ncbi:MAG: universal stress protein [Vicinamibacterales bacterium]
MIAFRRIICPIDFSESSRHALDHAVAIARWYGGAVTALHVLQPIPYTDPLMAGGLEYTAADVERTERDLARFVDEEIGSVMPIEIAVLQGVPALVIVEQARLLDADLIVLGTHGRRGFERFMLGSVAERVLRKASCPVLTVPARTPDAVGRGPVVFNQILCGVDFSPASAQALTYAASLARWSEARLTAMHVVEARPLYEPSALGASAFQNFEAEAVEAATGRLRDLVPRDVAVTEVIEVGKPYRALLDRCAADGSDLIVIGVHSGVSDRLGFFGSTTNHIVREATCPVLSLRG